MRVFAGNFFEGSAGVLSVHVVDVGIESVVGWGWVGVGWVFVE